jgi:hypothetical protein
MYVPCEQISESSFLFRGCGSRMPQTLPTTSMNTLGLSPLNSKAFGSRTHRSRGILLLNTSQPITLPRCGVCILHTLAHRSDHLVTQKFKDVLALNSSTMNRLQAMDDKCGFTDYSEKYATYPPKGPLPLPPAFKGHVPDAGHIKDGCRTFDAIFDAATA